MNCTKCGTILVAGTQVCPTCGQTQPANQQWNPQMNQQVNPQMNPQWNPQVNPQMNAQWKQPVNPQMNPQWNNRPVQNNGKTTAGFVLALVSLITWIIPLFGLPTSTIGLILSINGRNETKSGMALAGIIISIIALIFTICNSIAGVLLNI
ncbi:MAG: hypothetical protein U0K68_06495 [Agathobacter sp.]|nr:hypothetical protein [Agathobacter sp.]